MTFLFPDDATLRLVLTTGAVPVEVSLAPCRAGSDAQGRVWITPGEPLPRSSATALRKFGVQSLKAEPTEGAGLPHWLAAVPVVRETVLPPLTDQSPVIFELEQPNDLAELVGEILRLGNDRQSFRFFKDGPVLLRVMGPPYYSLLRAIDRLGEQPPRAYREIAPRVWVQIGWSHPLAEMFRPANGQFLLLRPGDWQTIDEGPWQDIYEVLEFPLPAPLTWADAPPAGKLAIPIRFAAGNPNEQPELWIVDGSAEAAVDTLIRDADERLLSRLAFAVAERDGQRTILLRARPHKSGPPVLVLDALACRPYLRLPNLFVPVGKRLRPPLRRDAIRKLLAADPDIVTWLKPDTGDTFAAQSLPESAFRPLEDWVDYILDRDREALSSWMRSAQFDFGEFVGQEELIAVAAKPKAPETSAKTEATPAKPAAAGPKPAAAATPKAKPRTAAPAAVEPPPPTEPDAVREQLRTTEEKFVAIEGPLDAPARLALWPQLGRLNASLRNSPEAALCFANALWESPDHSPALADAWAKSESITLDTLDQRLALERPTPPDVRAVAALCVAEAGSPGIASRLPRLLRYLEQNERLVPVRISWLAWHALTQRASPDPLALARGRDRTLERLLTSGLSHERDLPDFLRFAGQSGSERMRAVREGVARMHDAARRWVQTSPTVRGPSDQTPAYVDLAFAFGSARLAEPQRARALLRQATDALDTGDPVHSFLLQAFAYRIEQALAGRPHAGGLPAEWMETLEHSYPDAGPMNQREIRYKIDRLRENARLLEPHERVDAYRNWKPSTERLGVALAALPEMHDRTRLSQQITRLLGDPANRSAESQVQILVAAFDLAARLGEDVIVPLIPRAVATLAELPPPNEPLVMVHRARLVEQALHLAAHYDRADSVRSLTSAFVRLLESQPETLIDLADVIVDHCLRGLRKLGLRDELSRLLETLERLILQGEEPATLVEKRPRKWDSRLAAGVHVAAGWMAAGDFRRGEPVLSAARSVLLSDALNDQRIHSNGPTKRKLAVAYASALGQAPADYGLRAGIELFESLGWLPNTATTQSHYAIFQYAVVEAAVLAVASEEFAIGPAARRWLEDDEFLVRRRIHRDVRHGAG